MGKLASLSVSVKGSLKDVEQCLKRLAEDLYGRIVRGEKPYVLAKYTFTNRGFIIGPCGVKFLGFDFECLRPSVEMLPVDKVDLARFWCELASSPLGSDYAKKMCELYSDPAVEVRQFTVSPWWFEALTVKAFSKEGQILLEAQAKYASFFTNAWILVPYFFRLMLIHLEPLEPQLLEATWDEDADLRQCILDPRHCVSDDDIELAFKYHSEVYQTEIK